ncbi:MAG: hypothetical protein R3F18_20345 [Lysobacterales bacterium]|nr:hypothetical protein [Xanthomonadales bacterium]MCB1613094.1 hypothetical protein [Xanthomonadales bacterium]
MFIPLNEHTAKLSQKLVWFEPPGLALANPIRFLAYAFRYARFEEMSQLREYLSDDELRQALRQAPPGIIDPRSWAYWHLMLDLAPQPLPERDLGTR